MMKAARFCMTLTQRNNRARLIPAVASFIVSCVNSLVESGPVTHKFPGRAPFYPQILRQNRNFFTRRCWRVKFAIERKVDSLEKPEGLYLWPCFRRINRSPKPSGVEHTHKASHGAAVDGSVERKAESSQEVRTRLEFENLGAPVAVLNHGFLRPYADSMSMPKAVHIRGARRSPAPRCRSAACNRRRRPWAS